LRCFAQEAPCILRKHCQTELSIHLSPTLRDRQRHSIPRSTMSSSEAQHLRSRQATSLVPTIQVPPKYPGRANSASQSSESVFAPPFGSLGRPEFVQFPRRRKLLRMRRGTSGLTAEQYCKVMMLRHITYSPSNMDGLTGREIQRQEQEHREYSCWHPSNQVRLG
jgi:hypothetical protein